MKEIRIAWCVLGQTGGGVWYPDTGNMRELLTGYCAALCREHGPETHWVEEREA